MAKLSLTSSQGAVITAVDANLESAFADGVEIGSSPLLDAMIYYKDRLKSGQKTTVKNSFRSVLAALIKTLNLDSFRTVSVSGNIIASDVNVFVVGNGSGVTLTLPAANTVIPGHRFVVKDGSGTAVTKNITISTVGADKIDGLAALVIIANYGSCIFVCDGVSNFYVI